MLTYLRYLNYVIRHKWYVLLECRKLGITWLGLIHDWSKFRPSEFMPYARHFYGRPKAFIKDIADPDFDFAWLLHQKRNRHHWQWWILPTDDEGAKVMPVPMKYLREMLADWKGASKAQGHGGDIRRWWFENHQKIQIHGEAYRWLDIWTRPRE